MTPQQSSASFGTLPSPPRRGPSLRAPLLTTFISLAVAIALAVVASVFAGPHLADIFRVIGSGGQTDAEALRAPIQNILSPGMFLVGSVAVIASAVFSIASLWLLIAVIIRISRR